jgi:hypothetical protein
MDLVEQYGIKMWEKVSQEMKNQTPRQCRDRWFNYLDPEISHLPWTPEEDQLLLESYQQYGNKWRKISSYFQNRNQVSVRNRFRRIFSRKSEVIVPKNNNLKISSSEFVFQQSEPKLCFGEVVKFNKV